VLARLPCIFTLEPRSPEPGWTPRPGNGHPPPGIALNASGRVKNAKRLRQAQADLAHINRVTTMGELTASLAHEIKQAGDCGSHRRQTCLRVAFHRDEPNVGEACEAVSRIVTDVTRAAEIH